LRHLWSKVRESWCRFRGGHLLTKLHYERQTVDGQEVLVLSAPCRRCRCCVYVAVSMAPGPHADINLLAMKPSMIDALLRTGRLVS
jgi:hypothetical protein